MKKIFVFIVSLISTIIMSQMSMASEVSENYKEANLFFTEEMIAKGVDAQHVTLSDNGTTVIFTSNSDNAEVDASNGFFGNADEYETIGYRYRPGGKSSGGINSENKGVFTFPCAGTLRIYAFNSQPDERKLSLIQNDITLFERIFKDDEYVNPSTGSTNRKVYPVYDVEVSEGTLYFLWPDNQLMLYGFKFIPNLEDNNRADLLFCEDMVAKGKDAQLITLSDNGTTVIFTSNSDNAEVDASNGFFGNADEYETIGYRYRPGGKSSGGINSENKGVFTFPCAGTLRIYAFNSQPDERKLSLIQNDITLFERIFKDDEYVNPSTGSTNRKVYPVYDVEVSEGTLYFLWPDNQLMLYGFRFYPKNDIPKPRKETLYFHYLDENGDYIRTNSGVLKMDNDGNYSGRLSVVSNNPDSDMVYFIFSDDMPKASPFVMTYSTQTDWSQYGNIYHSQNSEDSSNIRLVKYESGEIIPFTTKAGRAYNFNVNIDDEEGIVSMNDDGIATGVEGVSPEYGGSDFNYNILGVKVDDSYKGVIIRNGKKYINR